MAEDLIERLERLRRQGVTSHLDNGPVRHFVEMVIPTETGTARRYPTLFTRIPLFVPLRRRADRDTDWHTGDLIATPWGGIRRFGPGLDIYDEDTLIALLNIARQRAIKANRHRLPIPLPSIPSEAEEVVVHTGVTSAYAINRFLGRQVSGRDLRACRQSIQRLAKTSLLFLNDDLAKEGMTHLLSYLGDQDARGQITVQFYPALVTLLDTSYSFIDLEVRSKLSDLGKAVHRFLSSQPAEYQIRLDKLKGVIGYHGAMKDFERGLIQQLEKLIALDWLSGFDIQGTGRRVPFVLHLTSSRP